MGLQSANIVSGAPGATISIFPGQNPIPVQTGVTASVLPFATQAFVSSGAIAVLGQYPCFSAEVAVIDLCSWKQLSLRLSRPNPVQPLLEYPEPSSRPQVWTPVAT